MTSREFDSSVCNKTVWYSYKVGSIDAEDYDSEERSWMIGETESEFACGVALESFREACDTMSYRECVIKGAPVQTHYADDISEDPDFYLPPDVLAMYRIADLRKPENLSYILRLLFSDELDDLLTLAKADKHPDDPHLEWYQKRYYHFVCVRERED